MVLKERPLRSMAKSMLTIVMVECAEQISVRIRKARKAIEEVGEINTLQFSPSLAYAKMLKSWEGLNNLQIISSF